MATFIGRKFKTAWEAGYNNGPKAPGRPQHFPRFFLKGEERMEHVPIATFDAMNMHNMISASLLHFQLIEEAIREYFKLLSAIISDKVKDIIPSGFQFYEDNDTLGTLIKKFEKLNNNKELIKELNKINKDRIYVAHKIWPHYMASLSKAVIESKGRDQATLTQALDKVPSSYLSNLRVIVLKTTRCLSSLADEQKKIRAKGG